MRTDVTIIGAGAAGMMCAIEAARRGRRVLLVDHAKAAGEKIRISGGGRCNFTNLDIRPDRFLSQNPHFAKSALKRYTQWDFIAMVEAAGISWHEKVLGQLFCDRSAKDVIAMLLDHMRQAEVELRLNCSVNKIEKTDSGFQLRSTAGLIETSALVIACGGKSIPKMGATGFGYEVAAQFDLPIIAPRPALVPLTFAAHDLALTAPLSGSSLTADVSCNGATFREGFLFTHRGLSGPSILQVSSYWREGDMIAVDLDPAGSIIPALKSQRQENGKQSLKNALAQHMPEKLAALLTTLSGLDGRLADQSNDDLERLEDALRDWHVKPAGSEGYRTAEVTLGGVDTDALDSKTMAARAVPNLYFIGEVVDVTGWLGGYNFQWAWSSGWAAGQVC